MGSSDELSEIGQPVTEQQSFTEMQPKESNELKHANEDQPSKSILDQGEELCSESTSQYICADFANDDLFKQLGKYSYLFSFKASNL